MKIIGCKRKDAKRFLNIDDNENIISVSTVNLSGKNILNLSGLNEKKIIEILKWIENKRSIIISCDKQSIMSALVYIIACKVMPVDHALSLINFKLYQPDKNIVEIGSKVIGNKKMLKKLIKEQKKYIGD